MMRNGYFLRRYSKSLWLVRETGEGRETKDLVMKVGEGRKRHLSPKREL